MSVFSRSLIAGAAGLALIGLAACSSGKRSDGDTEKTSTSPAPGRALASFDPCTFFKADELTSWGLPTQSETFSPLSFEPGCRWVGEKMDLTLQKNLDETVASYRENGSWDFYNDKAFGGRTGALAAEAGVSGTGGCTVLVDTGGGVAIYMVSGAMRDSVDACAEAEKIANQTASRLPK
ncbi:DUF3558 family protein [Saccharopolyspora sp. NPDC000995]